MLPYICPQEHFYMLSTNTQTCSSWPRLLILQLSIPDEKQ